jgi:hypothetical protein
VCVEGVGGGPACAPCPLLSWPNFLRITNVLPCHVRCPPPPPFHSISQTNNTCMISLRVCVYLPAALASSCEFHNACVCAGVHTMGHDWCRGTSQSGGHRAAGND